MTAVRDTASIGPDADATGTVSGHDTPFWSASLPSLYARLGSSSRGLTSDEAARRLRALGPATLRRRSSSSGGRILVRQFANPLVLLLTIAAALSLVVGQRTDSAIILVVVVAGGALGFWQERRAADAV